MGIVWEAYLLGGRFHVLQGPWKSHSFVLEVELSDDVDEVCGNCPY